MDYTANGQEIREGLVCYDNNLDVVVVGEVSFTQYNEVEGREVAWYKVHRYDVETGLKGGYVGIADGGRLSTVFRDFHGKAYVAPAPIKED